MSIHNVAPPVKPVVADTLLNDDVIGESQLLEILLTNINTIGTDENIFELWIRSITNSSSILTTIHVVMNVRLVEVVLVLLAECSIRGERDRVDGGHADKMIVLVVGKR